MSDYRLTYFDFGGRAEPIRIALHAAGVAFEDKRISYEEFAEMRGNTPFNSVPVLEIDGEMVAQSNAISRYVGRMAGLYPDDPLQALYCDEVLGAIEDVSHYVGRTFGLEGDELKQAREALAAGWLTVYLKGLAELLVRGGGQYFADHRLTVADLKASVQVDSLRSGQLDHIPKDLVDRLVPSLVEHAERVKQHPTVAAYHAAQG
jgi:glutathione S-transferase